MNNQFSGRCRKHGMMLSLIVLLCTATPVRAESFATSFADSQASSFASSQASSFASNQPMSFASSMAESFASSMAESFASSQAASQSGFTPMPQFFPDRPIYVPPLPVPVFTPGETIAVEFRIPAGAPVSASFGNPNLPRIPVQITPPSYFF